MIYLACILVAIGIHRLWNMEDIFAPLRLVMAWCKPVVCMACNAFWIAAMVATFAWWGGLLTPLEAVGLPFAAYPVLRLAVWVYTHPWFAIPQAPPAAQAVTGANGSVRPPEAGCSTCADKRAALQKERARTDTFEQRVVIIAPHGLSAVLPQARAFAAKPGRLVQVWVPHGTPNTANELPSNLDIRANLPNRGVLINTSDKAADMVVSALTDKMVWLGNATIVTDRVLSSTEFPALIAAIQRVGTLPAFAWLHDLQMGQLVGVQLLPHHCVAFSAEDGVRRALETHSIDEGRMLPYTAGIEALLALPKPIPMPAPAPVAPA